MNNILFHIRKIKDDEIGEAMKILEKWNMAPRKATPENPSPAREIL